MTAATATHHHHHINITKRASSTGALTFSAEAALFHAAKRSTHVHHVIAVPEHHAGTQLRGHFVALDDQQIKEQHNKGGQLDSARASNQYCIP